MTKQLLIYKNAVPVSSTTHLNTSVRGGDSFAFAKDVNSVPLVASEFTDAATQFPIVFAGEGETCVPTAILGVEGERNAFVDADNKWIAKYVPGFIRRYPFVFSNETEDGRLVLCVDEEFDGVNEEGRGERLFDSDGNRTQYLQTVLAFLQEFQARFNRTKQYVARLQELDLLRPMHAQFTLPSGERRALHGFQVVDRERFKALDSDTILSMFRTDELECTILHIASLRHFGAVADMSTEDLFAGTAADADQLVSEDMG